MNRTRLILLGIFALLLVLGGIGIVTLLSSSPSGPSADSTPTENSGDSEGLTSPELREAVTPEGILEHVRRFAAIAEENGGNRAAGTAGYDASAQYVARTLREAGYEVRLQEFELPDSAEVADAELERAPSGSADYARGEDFSIMESSGSGQVTASVEPVDFARPEGNADSSSGCELEDFEGFREGSVALLRRGSCTFEVKVENAAAAGAAATLVSNRGSGDEVGLFRGSLGEEEAEIPVLATTAAVGEELADSGAEVRLSVTADAGSATTSNVIATLPGGDEEDTVVVGAHLDSTRAGPGINDNASGAATILEMAQEISDQEEQPANQLRFIFWGGEELGLLGSNHYVSRLSQEELDEIRAYLNFDMVASPNYVPFLYGTPEVEQVFENYFQRQDLETYTFDLGGRSDHGPFAAEGVPVGGIFSGDSSAKTEGQEESYGGEAGEPYDECYHRACDDLDNVSREALDVISDAAAHAAATFLQK